MTADPHTLLSRGVEQVLPSSESLTTRMSEQPLRVYLGIDPTGWLLTLGHAVVLRKLQQFAEAGHHVILLIGNGTVRIGDPTGRDSTRPELTDHQIRENFQHWKEQASRVLNFDMIEVRYNGDWLDKLTYQDMIKLLAQTTVQQLIERDMFQERIRRELPIFGHEILYPLLQGYDSVVLDVDLEIGGSDQLFNMMMGRQLQKTYNDREKWVLTTPIINGTDGRKMSKSYGNFIALTEAPADMYGKLMSVADSEILTYMSVLTDTPDDRIAEIQTAIKQGANPMQFKKELALAITTWLHDADQARAAAEHFEKTVQQKEIPDDIPTLSLEEETISAGQLLQQCMPEESNSNLRRLIDQGAVTLLPSGKKLEQFDQELQAKDLDVIKIGKRRYIKITNQE